MILSFGGSVAAMIHSIKQNTALLRKRGKSWELESGGKRIGNPDLKAINDSILARRIRRIEVKKRTRIIWRLLFLAVIIIAIISIFF